MAWVRQQLVPMQAPEDIVQCGSVANSLGHVFDVGHYEDAVVG